MNNYEIYICIDKNKYNIPNITDDINNKIKIIKVNNKECELAGYKDSVKYFKNKACNRDKTLYYFNRICPNIDYDMIWFIEEEVFVPDLDMWNNWPYVFSKKIEFPVAHSMICAVRVSKKLMKHIDDFVIKEKRLLYGEVLFNKISIDNNLSVTTPNELSSIVYRYEWTKEDINKENLYHPIKNTNKHDEFRSLLR